MAVNEEAVKWAFKFFLDRSPSEDAIRVHMKFSDENLLAKALVQSKEFALKNPFDLSLNSSLEEKKDAEQWASSSKMRIVIVGNCQVSGIGNLMRAMSGDVATMSFLRTESFITSLQNGTFDIKPFIESDLILTHPENDWIKHLEQRIPNIGTKVKFIPTIIFSAFHPDSVQVEHQNKSVTSAFGLFGSSLAFYGWRMGLSREKTISLFTGDVYEALGFFNYWDSSIESLVKAWDFSGLSLTDQIARWSKQGCWMHSIIHPKLFVLADVAHAALAREGIHAIPNVEYYLRDDLADHLCWPVYPEIGAVLGISDLPPPFFKKAEKLCSSNAPQVMVGLEEFVHYFFNIYDKYEKAHLYCGRMDSTAYQGLDKFLKNKQLPKPGKVIVPTSSNLTVSMKSGNNPYQGLADHQFWRRAMEQLKMIDVDPVIRSSFTLNRMDKVATAGSCFAQHISRTLQKQGFNYYVSEKGDVSLTTEEAQRRNFSVFSARFGNLYSARQLVQLFDRAYGTYSPVDEYWLRSDGKYVDPFRPQVEPDGFSTIADLESDRAEHFSAIREMFENLDVFVFTLGLTEAWRSRIDGAVFPLAPGVVAGTMDPSLYEFVNFGVADVVTDMQSFIKRLLKVNSKARMLVTVSPVPLIATYEDRHVLVSTTYSKSVLRAAAEEICLHNAMCEYFPSYEIITGNYTKGEYFESDLRSVKPEGVEHVMRLFLQHYSSETIHNNRKSNDVVVDAFASELRKENSKTSGIICDEEALDAS